MGCIADTGAWHEAQGNTSYGRVIVKICHVVEVTLKRLEVDSLVDLVHLRDEGGATVEDEEEKVNSTSGSSLQGCWVNVCRKVDEWVYMECQMCKLVVKITPIL